MLVFVTGAQAVLELKACRDVQIKPTLLPINENEFEEKFNNLNARLDVSARELWNICEKTFFDIRITHATSHS